MKVATKIAWTQTVAKVLKTRIRNPGKNKIKNKLTLNNNLIDSKHPFLGNSGELKT